MSCITAQKTIVWMLVAYCGATHLLSDAAGQITAKKVGQRLQADRMELYAKGLMKHYDKNRDGFIDHNEANKMRQSPTSKFDKNGDGTFSLNETTQWVKSLAQPVKTRTSKVSKEPIPSQKSVTLHIDLIEISTTSPIGEFETLTKVLNLKHENPPGVVETLKQLDGVAGVDSLICKALPGRKHVFHTGQRHSATSSRSRSNPIAQDIVELTPTIDGANIEVDLVLTKTNRVPKPKNEDSNKVDSVVRGTPSKGGAIPNGMINLSGQDAEQAGNIVRHLMQSRTARSGGSKSPTEISIDLNLQTSIVCQNGYANATFLSQSNRRWLLIVQAAHD